MSGLEEKEREKAPGSIFRLLLPACHLPAATGKKSGHLLYPRLRGEKYVTLCGSMFSAALRGMSL